MIYFDFSKPFDRVSTNLLLKNLSRLGSSTESSPGLVGVLSPFLFLVNTAELPSLITQLGVTCVMYADDVKVYKVIESVEDSLSLQAAIDQVVTWSLQWGLPLAADKTKLFCIGKDLHSFEYKIGPDKLERVHEVRDLGFRFNDKLSFETHYKFICSLAIRRTYNLFKVLRSENARTLVNAYKSYVRPLVETGTSVFSPHKKKDIALLECVQNNFTRKLAMRCSGLGYQFIPNGVYTRLLYGLQSLRSRRLRNDLLMAFKILTGRVSLNNEEFFSSAPSRTRRSATILGLHLPQHRCVLTFSPLE